MPAYSAVSILYNPNSTGSSKDHAERLAANLRAAKFKGTVKVISTEYAGHAETLAYELAKASPKPLIISSSGDGGYHETINGLLKAQSEGAHPTAGLLPGGNANDHYHSVHRGSIEKRILRGKHTKLDVLEITANNPKRPLHRYAHSYAGVGMTPQVGKKLTERSLNPLTEMLVTIRTFFQLRPVTILIDGERHSFDSLVFSNAPRMAKFLKLSPTASLQDGKFEVTAFPAQHKFKLMKHLLQSARGKLDGTAHAKSYTFTATAPLSMQLDGEVYRLKSKTEITVSIAPKLLQCIV